MASSNIFDIQISNEKAFSVYKDVYGPARRQNSRGASDEDFQIVCDILEICGVKLVKIEENVNVSKMQYVWQKFVLFLLWRAVLVLVQGVKIVNLIL